MGNQIVKKGSAKKKIGAKTTGGVVQVTTKTMSRSPSGTDFQNGDSTHFVPVNKLAKVS